MALLAKQTILGLSAYYHDSAAALLIDGRIVAAAQEERFTRKKHDSRFPREAVRYVLEEAGCSIEDLTAIVFYDKPYIKFERLLETYHAFVPRGLTSFLSAIPVWLKEKLFMRKELLAELEAIQGRPFKRQPKLLFSEHHLSHAASTFYPSPFPEAAILTIDGVGEWTTTAIGYGKGKDITLLKELAFPHSLGLLYSAFTYYCGFKVNSGEYKLMGLAPYGHKGSERIEKWKKVIREELVDIREDGSLLLNMDYFSFATELTMCNNAKWEALLGVPPRAYEKGELTQDYMDLALAIQEVTEDVVLRLARTAKKLTNSKNLCLAGGVALNCVANGVLERAGIFEHIWIQPAAGDAGGALGAAYAGYHLSLGVERVVANDGSDAMQGSYLGPAYSEGEIERMIRRTDAVYKKAASATELYERAAQFLADGKVVGWFQGRMEYGPRALGNRSILGDARDPEMQKRLNLKIKQREGFRPFAPSVLEEYVGDYFDRTSPSPYMLLVSPVRESRRKPLDPTKMGLYDRLYSLRSDIQAVTHIDYSARIQTVSRQTNERYWSLIEAFRQKTGYALLVNTSFNVRGEPIVCTPHDAYRCFMSTDMDVLVVGDYLFEKGAQTRSRADFEQSYEAD